MKTILLKLKQNRLQTALAGLAGTLVLLLILYFSANRQPPLTAEEQLLVGEWEIAPDFPTRFFHADRSFERSDRDSVGTWKIKEGRLSITSWQPYKLPSSLSVAGLTRSLESIQRSRKKCTEEMKISFSDKGQRFILDRKWEWSRKESQ